MLAFLRWQWLWRSRGRVLAVGLGALAAGGLLVTCSALQTRPLLNRYFYVLAGLGVFLIVWGGIHVLNGLFAPAGAFRDHDFDDSREGRRRAWRRQRTAKPSDDRPLPLAPDTGEATRVISVRCPACHEPLAVEGAGAVECPKCHERFTPE